MPYWRWFGAVVAGYRPEVRWPGGCEAIVGYAKNYRLDDLRPFVTSVRERTGRGFLLIAALDEEEKLEIERSGGAVVAPFASRSAAPLPMLARIMETHAAIAALPGEVERIVWCDTRDLVFQDDPFRAPFEAELTFFSEASTPRLGDTATGAWLARALGPQLAATIRDEPMVNAGVVYGNRTAVQRFLHIVGALAGVAKHRLTRIQSFGLEQAIFNYVAHHRLAGTTEVKANLGSVANLYGVPDSQIVIREGKVLSPFTGNPFDIVHMFDRNARTRQWAADTFGWRETSHQRDSAARAFGKRGAASLLKRLPEIRW